MKNLFTKRNIKVHATKLFSDTMGAIHLGLQSAADGAVLIESSIIGMQEEHNKFKVKAFRRMATRSTQAKIKGYATERIQAIKDFTSETLGHEATV